jgi:hypothetical protein
MKEMKMLTIEQKMQGIILLIIGLVSIVRFLI